jgi:hypothetical protein
MTQYLGRIYDCGGPGAIKMWRPLLVTTYLTYDSFRSNLLQ